MGFSIRAYARHRGVSHVAVLRAIKTGRVPAEPDGTIDAAKADAAWARSTDPAKARKPKPNRTAASFAPFGEAAIGSVRETLKEQGLPAGGNVTFVQARTAHEIAKAHLARLRLQRMKGELVDRATRDGAGVSAGARGAGCLAQLARAGCRLDGGRARRGGTRGPERSLRRMSAPTSPNSPTFDPSSDDLFGFDGAEELGQAWRDGLTPDPALTVSEWADRHRVLSPRASAEPGRYRTDRTPYMRAIMDALSPAHPARRIVFMKAAQVGATEAGNNWIGYVIHHAPGPMLAVQPTVELAKRFSRQRIEPLIEESPSLRERVKPARSRDAGNTVLSKEFPAGLAGHHRRQQRGRPALDAGALSVPRRGRCLSAVGRRGRRSRCARRGANAHLLVAVEGVSRHRRRRSTAFADRARVSRRPTSAGIFVPCPHCGEMQWLQVRAAALGQGQSPRPHIMNASPVMAGSRSITRPPCSRPASGARLRRRRIRARSAFISRRSIRRSAGSPGQTSPGCGRPRSRPTKPSAASRTACSARPGSRPARRRTGSGSMSAGKLGRSERCRAAALFLTAGADVQKDRIEVRVWAWGRGLESWLVDHIVIEGGPERAEELGGA